MRFLVPLALIVAFGLASPAERLDSISLDGATIDLAAAGVPFVTDHRLVKFPGPIRAEDVARLRAATDRIYTYLPYYAYLVRSRGDAGRLRAAVHASFVAPYLPDYKLSCRVKQIRDREEPYIVTVLVFPDARLDRVKAAVGRLGNVVGAAADPFFSRIRLLMKSGELRAGAKRIAAIPEVFFVDIEPRKSFLNDTTIWVGQSGTSGGQATPVFANGIYGQGQVVGILDTGIDADMCYFADSSLPPQNVCDGGTTVDQSQRKVLAVDFLWSNECQGGIGIFEWDTHSHGTHVAGIAAGDQGTPLTHDSGDGMAPGAKVVMQDCGFQTDNCADCPGIGCPVVDLKPIFQQAYDQGARIHTNSYGDNENAPVQNNYTSASQDVDQFMWNHKDFLLFYAAGNSGPGNDTVGSPSTAKNCLSVGATARGSSAESMASFSSCGYTDDGRIKPDLTIPGESIVSARNDWVIGTNNCGTTTMSGTSMASPAAAGLAALVREYFTAGYYPTGAKVAANGFVPKAALVKAALLASTHDMQNAARIPSRCQGWGRILLDNVLYFPGDTAKLAVGESPGFATGAQSAETVAVDLVDSSTPLRVSLAWTDYPSTPAAMPHLNNDLDLEVLAPDGTLYRGNVFSGGSSVPGGSADRLNSTEQVRIATPKPGSYRILVRAANIPNGPQPYALVVAGGIANPGGKLKLSAFQSIHSRRLQSTPAIERTKLAAAEGYRHEVQNP